MATSVRPEKVLGHLGGCGRYQILLATTLHSMKLTTAWTLYAMVMTAVVPRWRCKHVMTMLNTTEKTNSSYNSLTVTNSSLEKTCSVQGQACDVFEFDDYMTTMVSEWNLVCSDSWIPPMIASVQMVGLFIGNFVSGQVADAVGRKIPLFSSLAIILVFNIMAFLSTSWVMFAVARTAIGVGAGCFLTIQYTIVTEVTWAKWRAVNVNVPSWSLEGCLFALVGWALKDWRYMHLITGLLNIPFMATWWFIQESFRWYLSHDRPVHAKNVLQNIAKFNKRHLPDDIAMELIGDTVADTVDEGDRKKYSFLDLIRTKYLIKVTVFLLADCKVPDANVFPFETADEMLVLTTLSNNVSSERNRRYSFTCRLALGMVSYGIQYGMQALSGDFFLNLFFFSVFTIPSGIVGIALANTIGRRYGTILSFVLCAIACLVVGTVQRIETEHRAALTKWFAILASFSISVSWGLVQTMTLELYPTVIRNIGYGFQNTLARIGAVIGPQIAYLDTQVAGVMYFILGMLGIICIISSFMLPETKNVDLEDKISVAIQKTDTKQK